MLVTLNKNWNGMRAGLTVPLDINVARSLVEQGIASDPSTPAGKGVTAPDQNKMVTGSSSQKHAPPARGTGPGVTASFPVASRSPRHKFNPGQPGKGSK